jgi:hypothetical protein
MRRSPRYTRDEELTEPGELRVSAKSKTDRPLSHTQFVAIVVVLAVSGVLALITLARVAGPHGKCPSETQVWRPAASTCFAAYTNKTDPQLVGHQAATG